MKSPIVKGAGFGMIAKGGSSLVEVFAPNMIGEVEELFSVSEADSYYLNAPADQSVLSAPADQSIMSEYYMNENDVMNGDLMMSGEEEDDEDFDI